MQLVADCLQAPAVLSCETNSALPGDVCAELPPALAPGQVNDTQFELPPIDEGRFKEAYDIAALIGISDNNNRESI